MTRSLKLYITGLVGAAAIALLATGLVIPIPIDPLIALHFQGQAVPTDLEKMAGVAFWIVVTLFASALPVTLSEGVHIAVSTAPLMAATALGGPTAGALVAVFGTLDMREIRGKVPWYGVLTNHAAIVLPVIAGGLLIHYLKGTDGEYARELVQKTGAASLR